VEKRLSGPWGGYWGSEDERVQFGGGSLHNLHIYGKGFCRLRLAGHEKPDGGGRSSPYKTEQIQGKGFIEMDVA